MIEKLSLEKILFLDIETTSGKKNFSELTEKQQELFLNSMKNKGGSEAITEEQKQDLYDRLAPIFASENGKIICISVGRLIKVDTGYTIKMISFADRDEKTLLTKFVAKLGAYLNDESYTLCGHNALVFDFPTIARRMLVNGISLPVNLNFAGKEPWKIKLLCTKKFWSMGVFDNNVSLDSLCNLFGIESPKGEMSGEDVKKVFYSDDTNALEKIRVYCQADVVALIKVVLKLRCLNEVIID